MEIKGYTNPVLCVRAAIRAAYPDAVFDEDNVRSVAEQVGERPDLFPRIILNAKDVMRLAAEAGFIVWFTHGKSTVRFQMGTL